MSQKELVSTTLCADRKRTLALYRSLYVQVLAAVVLGVVIGHFQPQRAAQFKPLGDGFIKLIKMLIAPIIFCTVVTGIAGMEDMKKVGKTGGGFIVLAATLSAVAHVPVAGLALILGIDRFMSEARALTKRVGNAVATLVVAKWTDDLDTATLEARLDQQTPADTGEPEALHEQPVHRLQDPGR